MKTLKENIAIVILGRPGSGKDTQAELLAKKLGVVHIVSSKLIEKALKTSQKSVNLNGKVYDVLKERKNAESGDLVNFNFVADLVKDKIKKITKLNKGIILSGSLRSLIELSKELPLLEKLYGKANIYIFHVAISPKEVYIRNLKRHRKDLPDLDTKKIIKKRLEVFNHYTLPVVKLLEKQKKIIKINGEQSIMKIHKDILWRLQSKRKKK